MVLFIVGFVVGFGVAALVYHNNKTKSDKVVDSAISKANDLQNKLK